MSVRFRFSTLAGWLTPLIALGLLAWAGSRRISQIEAVSSVGGGTAALEQARASGAPLAARNWLIVPEHNRNSYQAILQTQEMLRTKQWRLREVDYENAPFGRDLHDATPFRWWLAAVAWVEHRVTGRPVVECVESAGLIADPLLHAWLVIVICAFVGWRFGGWASATAAALLVGLYPFSTVFLGGAPDDRGLIQAMMVVSLLPLLAAARGSANASDSPRATGLRGWFFAAGLLGGAVMWLSPSAEVPLVAGIALGAIAAAVIARKMPGSAAAAPAPADWRAWAVGGAAVTLVGYLAEFAPGHLGEFEIRVVHPLYGLAWLGLGEVLAQVTAWLRSERRWLPAMQFVRLLVGLVAIALLPFAMWRTRDTGFLAADIETFQLTKSYVGATALNLWQWLVHTDLNGAAAATLLPLLVLVVAVVWAARPGVRPESRAWLMILLGPAMVAAAFGLWRLSWWSRMDGLLTVLAIATVALIPTAHRRARWIALGAAAPGVLVGLVLLIGSVAGGASRSLGESDLLGLIERDIGTFIAVRAAPKAPVVLAPPSPTGAFCYYAGARGLGTLSWENEAGLAIAVRILSASTPEEAKALIERRGVTHIVLPSWDPYMDEYARMGMGQLENTFMERLDTWRLPPWLRPLAYELPTIGGFEGRSVTILEVVEDQDDATAMSRGAEYFVQTGQLEKAAAAALNLRRFPADLGAVIARAGIEFARSDTGAFTRTVAQIKSRLTAGGDRRLAWDRRVSLAVVLAQAHEPELSRAQVTRCVSEATEARLRFLSAGSLYQLLVLQKAYGVQFTDARFHDLALALLPAASRERVAR